MPINFIPFSNVNVEYSLPKLVSKNENDTDNLISFLANFNEEKMNKFFFKNVNLDEVQNNISNEEAEELVWIFCKMPAPRGPKFHEWEDSVIKSNLILIEEANRQEMQSRKESDMYDWKEYYNDV